MTELSELINQAGSTQEVAALANAAADADLDDIARRFNETQSESEREALAAQISLEAQKQTAEHEPGEYVNPETRNLDAETRAEMESLETREALSEYMEEAGLTGDLYGPDAEAEKAFQDRRAIIEGRVPRNSDEPMDTDEFNRRLAEASSPAEVEALTKEAGLSGSTR